MMRKVNNFLVVLLGILVVILTELIMFLELNSFFLLKCFIFVDLLLVFIPFSLPRKVSSIIDAIKTRIFFFNSCLFLSKIWLYENKITIFWVYTTWNYIFCGIFMEDIYMADIYSISPKNGGNLLETPSGNPDSTISYDFLAEAADRIKSKDVKDKAILSFSSKDVPTYGQKKIYFPESSDLLSRRGLAPLSVREICGTLLTDKGLTPLNTAGLKSHLNTVDENLVLYKEQVVKFNNTLRGIDNGNEPFFPNSSKKLFEEYKEILPHMVEVNEKMGTNLCKEIKAKDPSFHHPLLTNNDSTSKPAVGKEK